MTRAEKAALEAYPVEIVGYTVECRVGAFPEPQDWNKGNRECYQQAYEQGQKETIERAVEWLKEHANDYIQIDVIDLAVDPPPTNPDASIDIFVKSKCWDDLKKALEEE